MRSFQWVIMLGFFTNTSLHRLFQMQLNMPGTARITTIYLMSLKPGLPEVPVSLSIERINHQMPV